MKKCVFICLLIISILVLTACLFQEDEPEYTECAHTYAEWLTISEATCDKEGVARRSCTKCPAYEIKHDHTLKPHTYSDDHDAYCNVCGHERFVFCGHDILITIEAKVADCTNDGRTEGKICYSCQSTIKESEVVKALGHQESDWITQREPTATAGGIVYKECTRCKLVLSTEYTPAIKLTELSYAVNDTDKTCCITGIGAFTGENLTIPEKIGDYTVTKIFSEAFCGETGLKTVKLPDTVEKIGENSFYGCTSLTEINLPKKLTYVGKGCLDETPNLSTVYYNASESFLNFHIYDREEIKTVVFGGEKIPRCILQKCPTEKEIVILEGVKRIGNNAFHGCNWLTEITIPSTLTHIDSSAFSECYNLKSVYISDLTAWCNMTLTTTTYSYHTTSPMGFADELYLNGELLTSIVIPDGITALPPYCFNSEFIESVEFNDELFTIGEAAFRYCSKLKELRIPPSLKSIGSYAFANCTGLERVIISDIKSWCEINFDGIFANPIYIAQSFYDEDGIVTELTIPSGVTKISDYAFYGAYNLKSIYLSDGITDIGDHAFAHCKNFVEISTPKSLISIGSFAFYNCVSLENLYFSGDETEWNSIIIGKENSAITTEAIIHYGYKANVS